MGVRETYDSATTTPAPALASLLHAGYQHPGTRLWQAERQLTKSALMYPIFISDKDDAEEEIQALPGQKRWGINRLSAFLGPLVQKGLHSVILFGVPVLTPKDATGTLADAPSTPVILAIQVIARLYPQLVIAADVCLCEYTSHGHCGILFDDGTIDNTKSISRIAEVAKAYGLAGAHLVAPSDMMDGRVGAIKQALIEAGLGGKVGVMAYSAKFATNLYGPFREAAGSVPNFGDRKKYQLPPNARGLARRAILRDVAEGADFIMTKPATPYLDILALAREIAPGHPLATYQVSGEFAAIHAAARAGVYDLQAMAFETVEGMMRAGATVILTYFTPDFLEWLDY